MRKRVYKFTSAEHGISDLANKRLKLSTIADLNDPFDLFHAVDTTDPAIDRMIRISVPQFSEKIGLLCFSRNWDNLLLWSHYASSHRGLCLAFDIPDNSSGNDVYMDVHYQPNLLRIRQQNDLNLDLVRRLLSTKHESWSYEQEVRMFVTIDDTPDDKGLLWVPFQDDLQLREVIIGVQCSTDNASKVCEVLDGYPDKIECTRAYMRSDAFLLVRSNSAQENVFRP